MLALLGLSPLRWNPFVDLERAASICASAPRRRSPASASTTSPSGRWRETSYGERRRVEIAMALAQNPKLLLLDEPFAGLSVDERRDVQKLLAGIPRDVTIVMIEHNMDVALDLADRITLLHFGEVIVEGTRAEVVGRSAHPGGLSWRLARSPSSTSTPTTATATCCTRCRSRSARAGCSASSAATAPASRPA